MYREWIRSVSQRKFYSAIPGRRHAGKPKTRSICAVENAKLMGVKKWKSNAG
jgi:hypothetical protein